MAQPTNGISVSLRDSLHEVKVGEKGNAAFEPTTVIELFKSCVKNAGKKAALKTERPVGKWITWTWKQYYDDVCKAAKSLIHLGVERFGAANVIGFNSPEWVIANFASIFAGGFAVGVYTTNASDACLYVAQHSEAAVIFVENEKQLHKYVPVIDQMPKLKAFVIWNGNDPKELDDGKYSVPVYTWKKFMSLSENVTDQVLEERMSAQKPGHCCTLVYTSGTTGNPKGVMLSHDALTWAARASTADLHKAVGWAAKGKEERTLTYLPLSHIAGQLLDLHAPMSAAGNMKSNHVLYFARPDALKGTLVESLAAVKPTGFFGVPRVYEKFHEGILAAGKQSKGLKKKIATWAKKKGATAFENSVYGNSRKKPSMYWLARKLVFSKVQAKFGLTEAKFLFSGAAPLSPDIQRFFGSLGLTITEGYGMSETCAVSNFGFPAKFKIGSPGAAVSGTEIKINNPDDSGEGEICFRGRHIMMGYMNEPAKTDETIDSEGFLHSGDIGKIDKDGLLFITGRMKDLIITAGGENVAPTPIEDAIKSKAEMVSQAVVIGDKRKYLTVLITLAVTPDKNEDGAFTDNLAPLACVVPGVKTVSDAQKSKAYLKKIEDVLKWYNKSDRCVSNAQKVQYFKILDHEFSSVGDQPEMTGTMKIKRAIVAKKHADEIEQMYTAGYSSLEQRVGGAADPADTGAGEVVPKAE